MSKLLAARGSQYLLEQEFVFNYNNWVVDSVDGGSKTLGSTVALSTDPAVAVLTGPVANTIVFDGLNMPPGAVIMGGAVIVETAYVGPTAATISVGIAGSTTALANAVDMKTAARTALTLTSPLLCNVGTNARLTIAYTVANATAGRVRVRIDYTIDGRVNEIQAS
jgi:hypothetical protein